jgi:hypothetical protein
VELSEKRMSYLETEIQCPNCFEWITLFVDPAGGAVQSTISDCDVCCRPIELQIRVDEEAESASVRARRDSESSF